MFVRKSKEETLETMLNNMADWTPITETSPGGLARSILEIINERLDMAYRTLDAHMAMSFLSTASGEYVDAIGELLNCTRLRKGEPDEESDENYKYRITQQVYVAATANEISLRLKCLSVPGVKDIIMTPYTRGVGSFTVHVITDELDTPDEIVEAVQQVIDENKAYGVLGVAAKPVLVPIDIRVRLIFNKSTSVEEINSVSFAVKAAIKNYIDNLGMGNSAYTSNIRSMAQSDPRVAEAIVELVSVNGKNQGSSPTYSVKWNERLYLNNIDVMA